MEKFPIHFCLVYYEYLNKTCPKYEESVHQSYFKNK
jgi:hypothetical protein